MYLYQLIFTGLMHRIAVYIYIAEMNLSQEYYSLCIIAVIRGKTKGWSLSGFNEVSLGTVVNCYS